LLEIRRQKKPVLPVKGARRALRRRDPHALFPALLRRDLLTPPRRSRASCRLVRRDLLTALAPARRLARAAKPKRSPTASSLRCPASTNACGATLRRSTRRPGRRERRRGDLGLTPASWRSPSTGWRTSSTGSACRFSRASSPRSRTSAPASTSTRRGDRRGVLHRSRTGIVVGETTVIGDRVKLYQGVTLGALSVDKAHSATKAPPDDRGRRRHLFERDDSGRRPRWSATTSVIGGNVWLTSSVPPHSVVYHSSGDRVRDGSTGGAPELRNLRPGGAPAGGTMRANHHPAKRSATRRNVRIQSPVRRQPRGLDEARARQPGREPSRTASPCR